MHSKTSPKKHRNKTFSKQETIAGWLFLLPTIIGFLVFTAVPFIMSFFYSLTDADGITTPNFVGLDNYINLLKEPDFINALKNTVYYTLGVVPIGTFLAIIVAVLLNQKLKFVNLYRSAIFIPVIVSTVSISMVWQWMYNQDYGLLNAFLGVFGLPPQAWIASQELAMPSVIIMSIWKGLGFNTVILLAGIQGISPSIYEAADIDGASPIRKFFKITLPLLRPTTMFVLIISLINAFQAFDQIYIMTKGGPTKATEVVVYLIYMNAFNFFKQGYASAMAYILFIIIFIASIVQLKISESNNI